MVSGAYAWDCVLTMLPTRAYTETIVHPSSVGSAARVHVDPRSAFVIAAAPADIDRFPSSAFTRYPVFTTNEALRLIEAARPRLVAIDWDVAEIDGARVCAAARTCPYTGVLVAMAAPERAPSALKAGCHAILLKPFEPNLVAARVGRLSRELPVTPGAVRGAGSTPQCGTHRVWPGTHCPKCQRSPATSFEFQGYRRMWYACLGCEAVWLGPRQE
jgi:CheY-like chemotaxis protein